MPFLTAFLRGTLFFTLICVVLRPVAPAQAQDVGAPESGLFDQLVTVYANESYYIELVKGSAIALRFNAPEDEPQDFKNGSQAIISGLYDIDSSGEMVLRVSKFIAIPGIEVCPPPPLPAKSKLSISKSMFQPGVFHIRGRLTGKAGPSQFVDQPIQLVGGPAQQTKTDTNGQYQFVVDLNVLGARNLNVYAIVEGTSFKSKKLKLKAPKPRRK